MSDYERSTTTKTLATLPHEIRAAILAKAESQQLTVPDTAVAFLTHSRKRKRGLLGRLVDRDDEHHTALVIGDKDVLVCRSAAKAGQQVLTGRLEDLSLGSRIAAETYAAAGVSPGDGMTINGFHVGKDRGSYYVGLGAPDGEQAREALEAALRRAKA